MKPECPLEQVEQRIERRVLKVRRATAFETLMRCRRGMFSQRTRQSRFANSRLARQKQHLSLAGFGLLPPVA
jgi:hypothetical protein